jgi:alkenylglycerophosphocholine hydrolase
VSFLPARPRARALLFVAAAAALAFLAGMAFDRPLLRLATKAVPAACLAWMVAGADESRYARGVAAGLWLSALGDFLLEARPSFFLYGLLAFLLAHLAYLAAFLAASRRPALLRAIPFAAWGAAAFTLLHHGLGGLRVPVAVYMAAIVTMMWRASAVGRLALVGAVLFGASDTLIAFDHFKAPLPWAPFPIILLYWAGQLLIALSATARAARDSRPA